MDNKIEKIRADIDALDKKLLGGLRERQALVRSLSVLKKEQGGAAFRPAREVALMRRLLLENGVDDDRLPPVALTYIWRQIIALSLFSQSPYRFGLLSSGDVAQVAESFASAKAYAGGVAPVEIFTEAREFFASMEEAGPMIGFIPCDEEIRTKWWRERTAETFVVGQWNYIMEMSKEPLYILAKQLPEPSGLASLGIGYEMEDRTLVVENDTLSSHAGFLTQEELEKNQTLIGAFTEQIPI